MSDNNPTIVDDVVEDKIPPAVLNYGRLCRTDKQIELSQKSISDNYPVETKLETMKDENYDPCASVNGVCDLGEVVKTNAAEMRELSKLAPYTTTDELMFNIPAIEEIEGYILNRSRCGNTEWGFKVTKDFSTQELNELATCLDYFKKLKYQVSLSLIPSSFKPTFKINLNWESSY